jgi:hypothetical protein
MRGERELADDQGTMATTTGWVVFVLGVTALLSGCKKQREASANSAIARSQAADAGGVSGVAFPRDADPQGPSATRSGEPVSAAAQRAQEPSQVSPHTNEPPGVDVGLPVEQAYAAIPHRRTVWAEGDSTAPVEEKAYLRVIFQVVDEAIAVRVAGLQNFSARRFEAIDVDGQFERLISFARSMPVPARLGAYHNDIVSALSSDQQFFAEWKSQGDRFPFAQQIAGHPGVRAADGALHAAYGELMSTYPGESQANKDAFFDYLCALDFL